MAGIIVFFKPKICLLIEPPLDNCVRSQTKDSKVNLMKSCLSGRAGCLYKQAAGSWNVLDTLGDVIICNHLSATRRFRHVREPSMEFHEVL
jgi:hypothetical protein